MRDRIDSPPPQARERSKGPLVATTIFVKSLFLVFLAGYLAVWKHEGIGGAVFILWYAGMS